MNDKNICSSKKANAGQRSKRSGRLSDSQIKSILIIFGVILFDLNPKDTCRKFAVPYRTYTSVCKKIISIIG